MSNFGAAPFLEAMNKLNRRDNAMNDLSVLFDEVSRIADKVADVDAKVALKVAAATGKGKIQELKGNL
jgi:hypothetical protein